MIPMHRNTAQAQTAAFVRLHRSPLEGEQMKQGQRPKLSGGGNQSPAILRVFRSVLSAPTPYLNRGGGGNHRFLRATIILLALPLVLAACGGGGGGSSGGGAAATPTPAPTPPPAPMCIRVATGECLGIHTFIDRRDDIVQRRRREYTGAPAFDQIHLVEAHASLELTHGADAVPGTGVKVAVIDSGLDLDHPVWNDVDISYTPLRDARPDDTEHGTAVTSVIGGNLLSANHFCR